MKSQKLKLQINKKQKTHLLRYLSKKLQMTQTIETLPECKPKSHLNSKKRTRILNSNSQRITNQKRMSILNTNFKRIKNNKRILNSNSLSQMNNKRMRILKTKCKHLMSQWPKTEKTLSYQDKAKIDEATILQSRHQSRHQSRLLQSGPQARKMKSKTNMTFDKGCQIKTPSKEKLIGGWNIEIQLL